MKVVGAVAGSRVNAAGAGFARGFVLETYVELDLGVGLAKRDVFAVHDQRSAVEPCMFRLEPVEL